MAGRAGRDRPAAHALHAVIDGFEFHVAKSTDLEVQRLTWSNYKKANTLKFLIGCTPGGSISYVSAAYPGSVADDDLTDTCGILELIDELGVILADKGFEILNLANKNKCGGVILPPRKVANVAFTPEQSAATTRVARLRIHVERCVQILRKWRFITKKWPHSCWPRQCAAVRVASLLVLFTAKPARSVADATFSIDEGGPRGRRRETRDPRVVHPNQCMAEGLMERDLLVCCLDLAERKLAEERVERAAAEAAARRAPLGERPRAPLDMNEAEEDDEDDCLL